jgi:hypothetical protein
MSEDNISINRINNINLFHLDKKEKILHSIINSHKKNYIKSNSKSFSIESNKDVIKNNKNINKLFKDDYKYNYNYNNDYDNSNFYWLLNNEKYKNGNVKINKNIEIINIDSNKNKDIFKTPVKTKNYNRNIDAIYLPYINKNTIINSNRK